MTAEISSKTVTEVYPNIQKKFVFFLGTPVNDTDYITFTGLTSIDAAVCFYTGGTTAVQWTMATNILTLANGSSANTQIMGIVTGIGGVVSTS